MSDTPETRAERALTLLDHSLRTGPHDPGYCQACKSTVRVINEIREAIAEARAEQLIEDANLIDEFERPGRIASRMMRDKADCIRAGGK